MGAAKIEARIPQKIEGVDVEIIGDNDGIQVNVLVDGGGEYVVKLKPQHGHMSVSVLDVRGTSAIQIIPPTQLHIRE